MQKLTSKLPVLGFAKSNTFGGPNEGAGGAEDEPEIGAARRTGPRLEAARGQKDKRSKGTRPGRRGATATAGGDAAGASPVDEGRMSSSPAAALVFPGGDDGGGGRGESEATVVLRAPGRLLLREAWPPFDARRRNERIGAPRLRFSAGRLRHGPDDDDLPDDGYGPLRRDQNCGSRGTRESSAPIVAWGMRCACDSNLDGPSSPRPSPSTSTSSKMREIGQSSSTKNDAGTQAGGGRRSLGVRGETTSATSAGSLTAERIAAPPQYVHRRPVHARVALPLGRLGHHEPLDLLGAGDPPALLLVRDPDGTDEAGGRPGGTRDTAETCEAPSSSSSPSARRGGNRTRSNAPWEDGALWP
ncbi:hypothetical protein THAOC_13926, partial [Thalassiosira oceanica]